MKTYPLAGDARRHLSGGLSLCTCAPPVRIELTTRGLEVRCSSPLSYGGLAPLEGLELSTCGIGIRCSIRLSYRGVRKLGIEPRTSDV